MSSKREAPPTNLRSLEKRIDNLANQLGRPVRRTQRAVANSVVGQMLPPGVVKGGTALKLRVGEAGSRFTPDFDAARASSVTLDDYLNDLGDKLAEGWAGFTGAVSEIDAPEPEGVPEDYVMRPFDIRLAYRSQHWLTVRFELGHDEIGSTKVQDLRIAADIVEMFDILGLDTPGPLPLLSVPHQVAQKLHACTAVNPRTRRNDRAHDLVDLQLLDQEEVIDLAEVAAVATRLFTARRTHPWPPTVVAYEEWDTIYAAAAEGLDVLDNVTAAVDWANDFIARASG